MITHPIFLMAPMSRIGSLIGHSVALSCLNLIAAVDDERSSNQIHGAARWSSAEFSERASQYTNAVAIDFSTSHRGHAWVSDLCNDNNIKLWHWSFAISNIYLKSSDSEINIFESSSRDSRATSLLYPETALLKRELLSLPEDLFHK